MRLRTLPLSLAGIIVGTALASTVEISETSVIISLVFTTAFLQILSNLSNELGDTLHGTDTDERQGIRYSLQNSEMTVRQMRYLISVIAVLCCISGIAMILCSFKTLFSFQAAGLLFLGVFAIWAAIRYTLGDNPYGYRGLGDIFVFIFFGLVSVLGAAYVCSHTLHFIWALPAAAIGCWSIGVLNVNNIRDMKTDAATRTTVALELGLHKARIYQTALIVTGWVLMFLYSLITATSWQQWIYFIIAPVFAIHLYGVWTKVDRALDPMLPMLVLSTFATTVLFAPFV